MIEAQSFVALRLATNPSAADELAAATLAQIEDNRERHLYHLHRALELGLTDINTCGLLIIFFARVEDIAGARETANHYIATQALRAAGLAMVSMLVLKASLVDLYPDVVAWTREFVEIDPATKNGHLLLVQALTRLNRWDEVWAPLEHLLSDDSFTHRHLHDLVVIVSLAAAHGYARQASSLLAVSPSASRLEPLAVALARILDEATNPPQEVSEVADDIVRDIERLRHAIAERACVLEPTGTGATHRSARRVRRKSRNTKLG